MTFPYGGPFRAVRVRLLPWRPKLRDPGVSDVGDVGSGLGDDLGFGVLVALVVLALPLVVVLMLFSLELMLLVVVLPFLLSGQLLGLLPWQLALTSVDGHKRYVTVKGTRAMLDARRHYRTLLAGQASRS